MGTTTGYLKHDWWPKPIPANVEIGDRTWVHSAFAFSHYRSEMEVGVRIGNDCGVYINSLFNLGPQGSVEIGDFSTIVGLIVSSNGRTSIGPHSFIAHDVVIADEPVAVPPRGRGDTEPDASPDIVIGENVWIGARVTILPGARLGEGAIVGAATVVDFEVPPFAVVAGQPARVVGHTGSSSSVKGVVDRGRGR